MKYIGLLYVNVKDLESKFGLSEDVSITNIIHDPITGDIEFVIRSHEEKVINGVSLKDDIRQSVRIKV